MKTNISPAIITATIAGGGIGVSVTCTTMVIRKY